MGTRRSLNDPLDPPELEVHATRRGHGGARHETTDRIVLRSGAKEICGWALNLSRGGMRVIVEDPVQLGDAYVVAIAGNDGTRDGRVVWVQEEQDGMVVGIEFVECEPGADTADDASDPVVKDV